VCPRQVCSVLSRLQNSRCCCRLRLVLSNPISYSFRSAWGDECDLIAETSLLAKYGDEHQQGGQQQHQRDDSQDRPAGLIWMQQPHWLEMISRCCKDLQTRARPKSGTGRCFPFCVMLLKQNGGGLLAESRWHLVMGQLTLYRHPVIVHRDFRSRLTSSLCRQLRAPSPAIQ